jgi:hypothetical protein
MNLRVTFALLAFFAVRTSPETSFARGALAEMRILTAKVAKSAKKQESGGSSIR